MTRTISTHKILDITDLSCGFEARQMGHYLLVHGDCFEWLRRLPENTLHAIVTDPPYGVHEYNLDELEKREKGTGGIWRIPPRFDGHLRSPLPRFTAFNKNELAEIRKFFFNFAKAATHALRPGGHIFIASNAIISQLTFSALIEGGLEFRGEIIRLVRTLRGGDRPKNAESEFPHVSSLPRGCYEPWGLFRKPLPSGMKVSECLRQFGTGGLRRRQDGLPFEDVIQSERTTQQERKIADHPSLKPQSFMRRLVWTALPLGKGIIADPFMGAGSTVAAAEAMGLPCVGIERHKNYFNVAIRAIPKLAQIHQPESLSGEKLPLFSA